MLRTSCPGRSTFCWVSPETSRVTGGNFWPDISSLDLHPHMDSLSLFVEEKRRERERARLRLKPNTSCPGADLKGSEVTCLLKEWVGERQTDRERMGSRYGRRWKMIMKRRSRRHPTGKLLSAGKGLFMEVYCWRAWNSSASSQKQFLLDISLWTAFCLLK